jgi:hypothetical protein
MIPLSVEKGLEASSRSKGVRMAQADSPMDIGALEMLLSVRSATGTVPGLSMSVVKGEEESAVAGEILRSLRPRTGGILATVIEGVD